MAQLGRSPTLTTLAVLVGVYALQLLVGLLAPGAVATLFVLSAPLDVAPWTLATSVYAHTGPGHLLANAAALLVVGLLVERETTPLRFHAFFLGTGALAGATEVLAARALSPLIPWIQPTVAVVGASGAIFGLLGYLLAGNRLTDRIAGWITAPLWARLAVVVVVAGAITWITAASRVALLAHFTGAAIGLLAGRTHLLRP